jgi:hypothetical protein
MRFGRPSRRQQAFDLDQHEPGEPIESGGQHREVTRRSIATRALADRGTP